MKNIAFFLFICLVLTWAWNIYRDKTTSADRYMIEIHTYYNKDHGESVDMLHNARLRRDGIIKSYFIRYTDTVFIKNTGIDSVIVNIYNKGDKDY